MGGTTGDLPQRTQKSFGALSESEDDLQHKSASNAIGLLIFLGAREPRSTGLPLGLPTRH